MLIVVDNPGRAHWVRLDDGSTGTFLTIEGIDETREGLLGIAFHPRFPADPRIFVHYALAGEGAAPDLVASRRSSCSRVIRSDLPRRR